MVSIVIPVMNEEANIPELQSRIATGMEGWSYEVIFVNDASTDRTLQVIERNAHTRVVHFSQRRGQSAAMLGGVLASTGKILVFLDGDLQNDPKDIPSLLKKLESGYDAVCGVRTVRNDSRFKKISSRIANGIRRSLLHDASTDTGCTLKAIRRECWNCIVPFRGFHRFIPAFLKSAGWNVTELSVTHHARTHGESKYRGLSRLPSTVVDLLCMTWYLRRAIYLPKPTTDEVRNISSHPHSTHA